MGDRCSDLKGREQPDEEEEGVFEEEEEEEVKVKEDQSRHKHRRLAATPLASSHCLPGITEIVFKALNTLNVRRAETLPRSTNSVTYLQDQIAEL